LHYFTIRFRYWREIDLPRRIAKSVLGLSLLALLAWVSPAVVRFLYGQPWTGFGAPSSTLTAPAKTLWDWLQLLLIPLGLALVAYFFRRSELASSRAEALRRSRDEYLSSYLDQMQVLLVGTDYDSKESTEVASKIASARTAALLRALDPERKSLVLEFLYGANLIAEYPPFVNLARADLSRVSFRYSSLNGAYLHGANLDSAKLERAYLYDAQLTGVSAVRADFASAYLNRSNLEYALLDRADFSHANLQDASLIKASATHASFTTAFMEGAILREVDLTKANLRKARLRGAYLLGARLIEANLTHADLREANLEEANLAYANLWGADLTGANLTNAIVTKKQLRTAKSTQGAKLDGIRDRLGPPRMPSEWLTPPPTPPARAPSHAAKRVRTKRSTRRRLTTR